MVNCKVSRVGATLNGYSIYMVSDPDFYSLFEAVSVECVMELYNGAGWETLVDMEERLKRSVLHLKTLKEFLLTEQGPNE